MPRPRKSQPEDGSDAGAVVFFQSDAIETALPKTAQVYELLRRAIVGLKMPPGTSVNEKALCEQLGISRTPLREALLQLSAENLVTVVPNSGTFVTQIDLNHVFDGQLVRHALELRGVRIAASKVTPEFMRDLEFNLYRQRALAADASYDAFYEVDEDMHRIICVHASSTKIWKIVTGAKAHLDRVRRLAIPEANHLEIVLEEHTAIIEGLTNGDPDAAGGAMRVHLERVFDTIRHLTREHGELFAPFTEATIQRFKDMTV